MALESRRAFLRALGLAPFVGPAVLRTLGQPVTTWTRLPGGLSVWTYRLPGWSTFRSDPVTVKEVSQRLSADTVRMTRLVTGTFGRIREHVTWIVRRGETVEGSTRYRQ